MTCLIGPNGAGKSTILKVVSGLLRPRQGNVMFEGKEIGGLSPRALLQLGIAHVPQERSLFPLMTVWENILMGGYAMRDRAGVRARAEAIAEQFPLVRERRNAKAGSLSGGEQKIVEIARALMLDPKLTLMDEPSIGLSPKARSLVFETIGDAKRRRVDDPPRRAERALGPRRRGPRRRARRRRREARRDRERAARGQARRRALPRRRRRGRPLVTEGR